MEAKIANKSKTCKHEYGQHYMITEIEQIPNLGSYKPIQHTRMLWARKCKKCGEVNKLSKSVYNRYMAC